MKYKIFFILFPNLFHILFAIIPTWNLASVGINKMSNGIYTYTVCEKWFYEHYLKMERTITIDNGVYKKTNKVIIKGQTVEVNFDDVESFYHLNNRYYICPKGGYHLYDFYDKSQIIPDGWSGNSNFELKCSYHNVTANFLVFYLRNNQKIMYGIYIGKGLGINKSSLKYKEFVASELLDYKLSLTQVGNNGEYYMLALIKGKLNLTVNSIKATLKPEDNQQSVNNVGTKEKGVSRKYLKAYFKNTSYIDYIDFFYITYNDINSFRSGYTIYTPGGYSESELSQFDMKYNDKIFEFFEDADIEKIDFMYYNKYVFYKMKITGISNKKYYGIFDIKLNKVIFNTEENLIDFIPYSDNSMLAVIGTSAYIICAIKNGNNCIDKCSSGSNVLLDTEGNKCSSSTTCPNGEYLLVPSGVCSPTCDKTLYIIKGKECGLCQYFNPNGDKYKLIESNECTNTMNSTTMEYYKQKFNLLKCKDGYKFSGNKCIKNITCFSRCKDCDEFSSDINDQKCTECNDGYLLEKGNCIETCSYGYYKKDKTCLQCSDAQINNCQSLETNTCNCNLCYGRYYLKNKQCYPCDSKCYNCNITAETCTECMFNQFIYKNKCFPCERDNCIENENDGCKCIKCKDGFYNFDYQCKSCIENCKDCTNSTKCIKCNENFFSDTNGQCQACPNMCKERKEDKCHCKTCNDGFFMDNNEVCQTCQGSCKTCVNGSEICTSCKNEHYFANENNKCEMCDDECLGCSGNKTNCTSCENGKYVNSQNKCEKCSDICKTCSGGVSNGIHNCLSCDINSEYKYLILDDFNKTCVENCSLYGREVINGTYKCMEKRSSNNTGTEDNNTNENNEDYILWIFVAVVGFFLLIVTICICKKCLCNKESEISEISPDSTELTGAILKNYNENDNDDDNIIN